MVGFNFSATQEHGIRPSRVRLTVGPMEWGGVQVVRMVLPDWPYANFFFLN